MTTKTFVEMNHPQIRIKKQHLIQKQVHPAYIIIALKESCINCTCSFLLCLFFLLFLCAFFGVFFFFFLVVVVVLVVLFSERRKGRGMTKCSF